jgi:hypothetical protein
MLEYIIINNVDHGFLEYYRLLWFCNITDYRDFRVNILSLMYSYIYYTLGSL